MTKREQILAAVAACLVPVMVLFMVFMWFIGTYNDQSMEVIRLQKQVKDSKETYDQAQYAKQRRAYYEGVSLPPDASKAKLAIDEWLNEHMEKDFGMRIIRIRTVGGGRLTATRNRQLFVIGNKVVSTVNMVGTLEQWVNFLDAFNRSALLKRLVAFKMTPKTMAGTGNEKLIRSGQFNIEATMEFVSLTNAVEGQPLTEAKVPLAYSLKEYQQMISQRNIFAPANNPPILKIASPRSAYAGDEVSFTVEASDADERDALRFELVSSEADDAVIESEPESRLATFRSPPLEVGEYKLLFRVADNGNPSKFSEKEVVLKVNKKRNNQPSIARESRTIEVIAGEPIKASIFAEDRDDDPVTFELMDTEIAGAKLNQGEGENEAQFVCDPLESGDYEFEVKLDDGKEPRMRNDEPLPNIANVKLVVLPPKFLDAQQTKITSITKNQKGEVFAWIDVRPKGVLHHVQAGDSFVLDRLTWNVRSVSIETQEVVFEVDGVLKTYKFRDFLNKPRREEPVAQRAEEAAEAQDAEEAAVRPALSKSDINQWQFAAKLVSSLISAIFSIPFGVYLTSFKI